MVIQEYTHGPSSLNSRWAEEVFSSVSNDRRVPYTLYMLTYAWITMLSIISIHLSII